MKITLTEDNYEDYVNVVIPAGIGFLKALWTVHGGNVEMMLKHAMLIGSSICEEWDDERAARILMAQLALSLVDEADQQEVVDTATEARRRVHVH